MYSCPVLSQSYLWLPQLVIDLDQKSLENQLGLQTSEGFEAATKIYRDGGHSKSYAMIKLDAGLNSKAGKGAKVMGTNADGATVDAILMHDADAGEDEIRVQYATTENADSHVGCKVGGLPKSEWVKSGCE